MLITDGTNTNGSGWDPSFNGTNNKEIGIAEDLEKVTISDNKEDTDKTQDKTGQGGRGRSRSRSKLRAGYDEASTLFDDGKYEEAYKKFELVFQGRKSSLGPEHPDTLEAKEKMALALDADGKYPEAFKMYSEVYTGKEKGPRGRG